MLHNKSSEKNASLRAEQLGQKCHFAPVLCHDFRLLLESNNPDHKNGKKKLLLPCSTKCVIAAKIRPPGPCLGSSRFPSGLGKMYPLHFTSRASRTYDIANVSTVLNDKRFYCKLYG